MRTIMIALQFFMRIRMLHCPLHYYAAHYTITLSHNVCVCDMCDRRSMLLLHVILTDQGQEQKQTKSLTQSLPHYDPQTTTRKILK